MPTSPAKLGIKCNLFLNTGTFGTPSWSPVTCVSDFTLSPKWDEGEASTRQTRLKLSLKTMLGLEFTGKLRASNSVVSGDTNYAAIIAALVSDALLDLMVLNGGIADNGATGFRADFQLHDATEDQGLGAVVFDEISFKPAPNTDGNYWSILVASGAPGQVAI